MTSRADRFQKAIMEVGSAKGQFEELRDELQEWLDNMPENLQSGLKAEQLSEAIDGLDTIVGSCEEVEFASIEFPGMFG